MKTGGPVTPLRPYIKSALARKTPDGKSNSLNSPDLAGKAPARRVNSTNKPALGAGVLLQEGAALQKTDAGPAPKPKPVHIALPGPSPREVLQDSIVQAYRSATTYGRRIAAVSRLFLDRPYIRDPLGEGPEGRIDKDPRLRLDAFDCLTYVEQMMALAHEPQLDKVTGYLDRIRYHKGRVGYRTRNHFQAYHWIRSNIKAGFVRDITRKIGGPHTRWTVKHYHRGMWRGRYWRWPGRLKARTPRGKVRLPYLPVRAAMKLADRVPEGTIIGEVRKARASHPLVITHVGLVVVRKGKRVFRHATSVTASKVTEQNLRRYLSRLRYLYVKWPVVGINLLEPRQMFRREGE